MRVLHVIPAVASRYGGPSTAVVEMARALAQLGVDVTIACTDADGPGRLDVPRGVPTMHGGVRTLFFPRVASEAFKYSPRLAKWLATHARAFDVVHIHAVMSHASVAAARECRAAGVPYVLRTLGTLDAWSLAQKPFKKRLFMRAWGQAMLARAAAVHATSAFEAATLTARWGIRDPVVLPLGIDDSLFHLPAIARDAPPTLVTMSRLHPVKGLELLIDAFARVPPRIAKPWRLRMAGAGDPAYVAQLAAHARATPAGDRIEFAGWLDGAGKRALLQGASLQALTSHHENFGVAVAEGLALGVPCVVSPAVQLAPSIEEAGAGWIAPLDRDAIARTLTEAMADADERDRRGQAARQLAARWRWSVVASDLLALYRRLDRRSPAGGPDRVRDAEPASIGGTLAGRAS